ncbi:MAG: tetratricopeptide repeat protein [Vicingaceae bacterium]
MRNIFTYVIARNEAILSLRAIMLFSLLFISVISFATPQDRLKSANDFYAEGNYEEAITEYQAILAADNISSDIYYNLGNCYYKSNDIPRAILNYEKALKLKPDNEDALFNLAMANKRTVDKVERLPELFIGNTWRTLVTSKTVDTWAYYTVGLIFLALLLFISYLLMDMIIIKKAGFYGGLFFLILSMFTFLMAAQHNSIVQQSSEAIIFTPSTTIQSEPNENSEELFTLHEGTKVTLLEESDEWSKIKLPNGNVGWIKSEEIEKI